MRILYLDIDSLRTDHLGCYGYARDTSPCIDRLAETGVRFTNCHVSDAPCLPSRTALFSGRCGLSTGVVDHGGTRATPFPAGPERPFRPRSTSWPGVLRAAGWHTATVSSFADRHAAWHWLDGFAEVRDPGGRGHETAGQIEPLVESWLTEHARAERWFLHVNLWDAHVPYRTPAAFGDLFSGPAPIAWLDAPEIERQLSRPGLRSAADSIATRFPGHSGPRQPAAVRSQADAQILLNGYDTGIRYADAAIGRILARLEQAGVLAATTVMVGADHGESFGELGGWAAHCFAEPHTMRVPMVVRWADGLEAGRVDTGLRYHFDVAAMLLARAGVTVPACWQSQVEARPHLVLSQLAQCAQRAVRFDAQGGHWWYLRTWCDGGHGIPAETLFELGSDPHCRTDLAHCRGDLIEHGRALLARWREQHATGHGDPLDEVLAQGGPQMIRAWEASRRASLP